MSFLRLFENFMFFISSILMTVVHRSVPSQIFSSLWFLSHSFHSSSDNKESAAMQERPGFNPWVGKILWRREWQPAPVFLPGDFHGQKSLAGYCPWSKKLDMTDSISLSLWFLNWAVELLKYCFSLLRKFDLK